MIIPLIRPFTASSFVVKFADRPWEFRDAAALRRQVFCDEQQLFRDHDRDAVDAVAIPIVAVSTVAVMAEDVVGTVRIHEPEPGLWMGSRLAVAADYRRVGALGASLIRVAVCSAHARGCRRFTAHVQSQNAPDVRAPPLAQRRGSWSSTAARTTSCRPTSTIIRRSAIRSRASRP